MSPAPCWETAPRASIQGGYRPRRAHVSAIRRAVRLAMNSAQDDKLERRLSRDMAGAINDFK